MGTFSQNIAISTLNAETATLAINNKKSPTEFIAATLREFSTIIINAFLAELQNGVPSIEIIVYAL
jgi:hypothetical protein